MPLLHPDGCRRPWVCTSAHSHLQQQHLRISRHLSSHQLLLCWCLLIPSPCPWTPVAALASHLSLIIPDHPCLEALLLIVSVTILCPDEVPFTGCQDRTWCLWSSNRADSCLLSPTVAVLARMAQRVLFCRDYFRCLLINDPAVLLMVVSFSNYHPSQSSSSFFKKYYIYLFI